MTDKYSANQIGYQIINEWYSLIVVKGKRLPVLFELNKILFEDKIWLCEEMFL